MLIVGAYLMVGAVFLQVFYSAQPTPFIDEIFHIPQAQKYCEGRFFEWDEKITTLPGLYIFSILSVKPISMVFSKDLCPVWALRSANVLFNTGSFIICYFLLKKLFKTDEKRTSKDEESNKQETKMWLMSLVVATFPLTYFFSFLFYTDPGSTFFVLAAYLASVKGCHKSASVLGSIAILFRQTNIVWVAFMAGMLIANHLDKLSEVEKINTSPEVKDKFARFLTKLLLFIVRYLLALDNLRLLLILIWPYLLVMFTFCVFVMLNGGITVGDRSSHEAVAHLAQLLYCAACVLFFAAPVLITSDKIKRFLQCVKNHAGSWIIGIIVCAFVLTKHFYEHPYLLADNRHYTFYIWRWFLGKNFVRFLFIPVYLYAVWSINDSLKETQCFLWRIVLLICVAASVVPQRLLEVRYFVLPYVIFRLHVKEQTANVVATELLLNVVVNAFTFAVFLLKTFSWPDLAEPQRMMW